MDIEHIKKLIKQGESKTLEFKTSVTQLKPALETACAFLNGKGGSVLIGVKNDGELVGQHVTDATRQEIAKEIKKLEPEPTASINIDYINFEKNKVIIVMQVNCGDHSPYTYDGRAFQRNESTTSRMTQDGYEQLLVERGRLNHSWEKLNAVDHTMNDLDFEEIRQAVKQGIAAGRIPSTVENENIESILKRWKLMKNGRINNAAVVLFAKEAFIQCHLKVGRFRGVDISGDFIDNRAFFGNAFRLLTEANNFIMQHLPIASFFETNNLQRIDKPALPVLAVREALVNAICHRDYSNQSFAIRLAIFNDRMEIWNNGKLPSSLTINDLKKKHESTPRNKTIAEVFYDRNYSEGWGMGTNKIFDFCREADIPEPKYEEYSGGIEITFKFKEPIGFAPKLEPDFSQYKSSTRKQDILKILQNSSQMTANEIAQNLQDAPSTRTIREDLANLKELKLINLQGFGRGSTWSLTKEAEKRRKRGGKEAEKKR